MDLNVIDPTTRMTPLMTAVKRTEVDTVKLLLDGGVNLDTLDADKYNALSFAMRTPNNPCLPLLLAAISPNRPMNVDLIDSTTEETPLMSAAYQADATAIQLLITAKANVSTQTPKSLYPTASYYAVKGNAVECLKKLLEANANPNTLNKSGETPLMIASSGKNLDLIKLLLTYKADLNRKSNKQETAIHYVIEANKLEALRFLIQAKADLTLGHPLFFALEVGCEEGVLMLLPKVAVYYKNSREDYSSLMQTAYNKAQDVNWIKAGNLLAHIFSYDIFPSDFHMGNVSHSFCNAEMDWQIYRSDSTAIKSDKQLARIIQSYGDVASSFPPAFRRLGQIAVYQKKYLEAVTPFAHAFQNGDRLVIEDIANLLITVSKLPTITKSITQPVTTTSSSTPAKSNSFTTLASSPKPVARTPAPAAPKIEGIELAEQKDCIDKLRSLLVEAFSDVETIREHFDLFIKLMTENEIFESSCSELLAKAFKDANILRLNFSVFYKLMFEQEMFSGDIKTGLVYSLIDYLKANPKSEVFTHRKQLQDICLELFSMALTLETDPKQKLLNFVKQLDQKAFDLLPIAPKDELLMFLQVPETTHAVQTSELSLDAGDEKPLPTVSATHPVLSLENFMTKLFSALPSNELDALLNEMINKLGSDQKSEINTLHDKKAKCLEIYKNISQELSHSIIRSYVEKLPKTVRETTPRETISVEHLESLGKKFDENVKVVPMTTGVKNELEEKDPEKRQIDVAVLPACVTENRSGNDNATNQLPIIGRDTTTTATPQRTGPN